MEHVKITNVFKANILRHSDREMNCHDMISSTGERVQNLVEEHQEKVRSNFNLTYADYIIIDIIIEIHFQILFSIVYIIIQNNYNYFIVNFYF